MIRADWESINGDRIMIRVAMDMIRGDNNKISGDMNMIMQTGT